MTALPLCISLMGPTASGKTDLAVALAERYPLEIISVDSALVYKGMDIGTAKPDAATLARAPHHLIDVVEPTEGYSAGRFRTEALALIEAIQRRGRIPFLVGGTMLYFRALKHGLDELPGADPALRAEIDALAARDGWPALHQELARLDPVSAARIQPNDAQRIQRALEVCLATGRSLSEWQTGRTRTLPFELVEFALIPSDRAWLHERIQRRFRQMLAQGFLDEVRRLRQQYALEPGMPAMRCVGYRQAWECLEGRLGLDEFQEKGIAATRQLAKRQLTWLRGWSGATVLDPLEGVGVLTVLDGRMHRLLGEGPM